MLKKLVVAPVLAVALVAGAALPASAWWWKPPSDTITDIVARSGGDFDRNKWDYDILLNAVLTAELDGVLADRHAEYTVFAPNDAAFVRLAQDLGYEGRDEAGAWSFLVAALTDLGGGDPIPVLTDVLLYHVAPGKLGPLQVIFAGEIDTALEGASFKVRFLELVDNEPDLRNPYLNIFQLNIKAANGVIHGINRVLIPVDLP